MAENADNPIAELLRLRPDVKWTRRRPPQIGMNKNVTFLTLEWTHEGREYRLDASTTPTHINERKEAMAKEALQMIASNLG